ncbi:MAG: hypothetical protein ACOY4H_12145 [Thermodesulfobacteriota bacterium]
MQQEFGRPASARSARGYELVEVLVDALRRCETISAAELKKTAAGPALPDGDGKTGV